MYLIQFNAIIAMPRPEVFYAQDDDEVLATPDGDIVFGSIDNYNKANSKEMVLVTPNKVSVNKNAVLVTPNDLGVVDVFNNIHDEQSSVGKGPAIRFNNRGQEGAMETGYKD